MPGAELRKHVWIPYPYDRAVIAGQGTIGLELVEQVADLTHVVVPIGGGGIISGIAVAAKALNPSLRLVGVQAAAAPAAYRSREMGEAEVTPEVDPKVMGFPRYF